MERSHFLDDRLTALRVIFSGPTLSRHRLMANCKGAMHASNVGLLLPRIFVFSVIRIF